MAEVLQVGTLHDASFPDGAKHAEDASRKAAIYDLGSNQFSWGLVSASAPNSEHIDLLFGGPVLLIPEVENPLYYTVTPTLAVASANIIAADKVQLRTSRHTSGVVYTVTLTSVLVGAPPP